MALPVITVVAQALGTIVGVLGKEAIDWIRQEAKKALRAARALVVWAATHGALRLALYAAVVAATEAFALYLTTSVVTPLAGNLFARLLPSSRGEFFYYVFWDSGLNAKRILDVILLYLANYTVLWRYFDIWLRGMSIALGVYKSGLRRQQAVLETSLK